MSQHLSSVGKAYERGFAIKDKSDTESEWCTNVSRCSDRHCSMVRSLRGPALRATDSYMYVHVGTFLSRKSLSDILNFTVFFFLNKKNTYLSNITEVV